MTEQELAQQIREIVQRVLAETESRRAADASRVVAIASDHGGFALKQQIRQWLAAQQYTALDCGSFDENPVDYPDMAYAAARLVSEGSAWRGIVIDGAGIGSCMAANKVPGVRAALCYDAVTARNAREHNDANVLTLGGKLIPSPLALEIVQIFLATECREPRHQKRVAKIMQIEKRYLRK